MHSFHDHHHYKKPPTHDVELEVLLYFSNAMPLFPLDHADEYKHHVVVDLNTSVRVYNEEESFEKGIFT